MSKFFDPILKLLGIRSTDEEDGKKDDLSTKKISQLDFPCWQRKFKNQIDENLPSTLSISNRKFKSITFKNIDQIYNDDNQNINPCNLCFDCCRLVKNQVYDNAEACLINLKPPASWVNLGDYNGPGGNYLNLTAIDASSIIVKDENLGKPNLLIRFPDENRRGRDQPCNLAFNCCQLVQQNVYSNAEICQFQRSFQITMILTIVTIILMIITLIGFTIWRSKSMKVLDLEKKQKNRLPINNLKTMNQNLNNLDTTSGIVGNHVESMNSGGADKESGKSCSSGYSVNYRETTNM